MKKLLLLLTLLSPLLASAQTTSVTATVTDPNGVTYSNGTWKVSFVNRPGFTGIPLLDGSPFAMDFNGALDDNGTFSVVLSDLSQISPLGSAWRFIICSASSGTCFESVRTEVIGGSVNLSTQLSAASPTISGIAFASIRFGSTETPVQVWGASAQSAPLVFMKNAKGQLLWQFSTLGVTFPDGTFQSTAGGGVGGAVLNVFGRTGSILATSGDYNFNQLAGSLATSQTPLTVAGDFLFLNTGLMLARFPVGANGQYLGVSSSLPTYLNFPSSFGAVPSVFGRTGAIAAQSNDYNFNQLAGTATKAQLPGVTAYTDIVNTFTPDQRFKSININSFTFASQFSGADICARIQAALNASAGGWAIADVSGNQTACAGGWTVPAGVTLFLNAASYTVGATIHIPSGAKMIGAGGNPNNGAGTVIAAKNSLNAPVVQLESNSGCSVVNSWHWSEVGWFRIEGNSANNTSATDGILVCASGENAIVHNILINDTKGAGVHYQGIVASTGATRDVSVFSAQNNAFWFENTTGAYAMESIADDGAPAFIKVAPGNGSFMLSVKKAKNDGGTTTANAPWMLIDGTLSGMQFYGESLQMGTFAAHTDAIQMINGNPSAIVLVNSNAPFAPAAGYTNLLNDNGTLIPLQRNFIEGNVSFFAWNGVMVDVQAGTLGFVKKQVSLGGGSGTKQDFQAPAPGFGTWNRIYNAAADYGFGGISFGNIGGFNFETDGRLMYLFNDTAVNMYFTDEDIGSAAGHRIRTQTGAQVTVPAKGLAQLMYMDKISFILAAPTGVSRTANVVTIMTASPHNLIAGENVVISGATGCAGTSPNGTFAVASTPTTNTFTYAQTGTTETCGGGLADYGRWLLSNVWPNSGGSSLPCTVTASSLQYNNGGLFGCTSATYTPGTGTFNFTQLANGNTLFKLKRLTDTSPTGNIFTLRDAADTTDLARLDATANYLGASYVANGAGAGYLGLSQGASQTTAACPSGGVNCILHQAPTAVTPFMVTWPGVAAAGVLQGSISGSGATLTNTLASVIPTSIFELPIGTCTSSTAATSAWDIPSFGTAGTVACVTDGSSIHSKPVLNYANSGTPEWWYTLLMPPNLTGNADMNLVWQTATVSGTATFNLDVICQNPNNTADTTTFSAGNFMAPSAQTASATANNLNLITVTNQAWPASCTSGTLAHFRLKRTDTGTAVTASVVTVQLTLRRTF